MFRAYTIGPERTSFLFHAELSTLFARSTTSPTAAAVSLSALAGMLNRIPSDPRRVGVGYSGVATSLTVTSKYNKGIQFNLLEETIMKLQWLVLVKPAASTPDGSHLWLSIVERDSPASRLCIVLPTLFLSSAVLISNSGGFCPAGQKFRGRKDEAIFKAAGSKIPLFNGQLLPSTKSMSRSCICFLAAS
jgi:hypothetical protein